MSHLIINKDGLIGDFLGSVPAMQEYCRINPDTFIVYHPEIEWLFKLTGLKGGLEKDAPREIFKTGKVLSCTAAWNYAIPNSLHMTQAYFWLLGLPVPIRPVKAKMRKPTFVAPLYGSIAQPGTFDVIAPFSRSLAGTHQLWRLKHWREFIKETPLDNYVLPVHPRNREDYEQLQGLENLFIVNCENPLDFLSYIVSCDKLISVVSGPSHLAYHYGVKNILISNQGEPWGVNPDALLINDYIPELEPLKLKSYINRYAAQISID